MYERGGSTDGFDAVWRRFIREAAGAVVDSNAAVLRTVCEPLCIDPDIDLGHGAALLAVSRNLGITLDATVSSPSPAYADRVVKLTFETKTGALHPPASLFAAGSFSALRTRLRIYRADRTRHLLLYRPAPALGRLATGAIPPEAEPRVDIRPWRLADDGSEWQSEWFQTIGESGIEPAGDAVMIASIWEFNHGTPVEPADMYRDLL